MQVFTTDDWATSDRFATGAGHFCGIAIGPESDEAIVRVGGVLLQAGRPLTLRSFGAAFTAERAYLSASSAIARLQLVAFECLEEVAAFACRANGHYGESAALTALGGLQRLITVPFVGRRHARFQLHIGAAATADYTLWGIAYNQGSRSVKESLIESLTGETPDANGTLAFHVGGTNEEECWDAIALEVTPASDATCSVDVVTIGEIGAR